MYPFGDCGEGMAYNGACSHASLARLPIAISEIKTARQSGGPFHFHRKPP